MLLSGAHRPSASEMDHEAGPVELQWGSTDQRFCSGAGLRVTVQRTFIEVMEECSDEDDQADVTRRSRSAPAAVGGGKAAGRSEGEVEPSLRVPGAEMRTTVVIRNIPVDCMRDQLVGILDAEGFAFCFDFLYLPVDFAKQTSVGNAFVNFTTPEHALRFLAHFDGFSRWGASSGTQAGVGWSSTQGLQVHVDRYRNSPIMNASDECKPIVLKGGARVDFPRPTKKVPSLRRLRTRGGAHVRDVPAPTLGPADAAGAETAPVLLCPLMLGLWAAPGVVSQDAAHVMASPLLAGLRREAACAIASPLLAGLKSAGGSARPASTSRGRKKAAWADQRDADASSECSTDVPSSLSGALWSSDGGSAPDQLRRVRLGNAAGEHSDCLSSGSEWHSDGGAAADRRCGSPVPSRRHCSMLAEGLVAVPEEGALPPDVWLGSIVEVVGAHGYGGKAVVLAFNRQEGTYQIQLIQNGRLTRRRRTIKDTHARLLQHVEPTPVQG